MNSKASSRKLSLSLSVKVFRILKLLDRGPEPKSLGGSEGDAAIPTGDVTAPVIFSATPLKEYNLLQQFSCFLSLRYLRYKLKKPGATVRAFLVSCMRQTNYFNSFSILTLSFWAATSSWTPFWIFWFFRKLLILSFTSAKGTDSASFLSVSLMM